MHMGIEKVLRWTEKYTRVDMVYATKNGFWVTITQVVNSGFSLLLIIAFANLLPKETYGIYQYILSVMGVLSIFTLTGMNSSITQAVAAGHEGTLQLATKYQLKWNLMMVAAFLALSGYYLFQGDSNLSIAYVVLGLFVPATLALNTYGPFLDGKREFKFGAMTNIASSLIYSVGMFITILLSNEVVWLVIAYALTTFLSTLFFYLYTLHKYKPKESHTDTTGALKYGRELTFIRFIGPIAGQIDKLILAHFYGAAPLATYALARIIPNRIIILIKKWVGIAFPKFAQKTPDELNSVFYLRILQGILIGSVVALLYILIAPYLFKYLLPQYIDGYVYSQILSLSLIFAIPNRYISILCESQKYSYIILVRTIFSSILSIVLFVIFGIFGGIIGLVIANVLNSFMGLLFNISMWRSATRKTL